MKHGVPQESILGPLLLITCMNDLLPKINTLSVPVIFADETGVIISNNKYNNFSVLSNRALSHMNKLFTANKLSLNLDEQNIIKFITNTQ
jgi:hypothetical protein